MLHRSLIRTRFILFARYRFSNYPCTVQSQKEGRKRDGRWWGYSGKPLLGLSLIGVVRELIGVDKVKLDDDPIKDQIKQSWLQRKYKNFDEAIRILEDVLEQVKINGEDSIQVTRVLDELANTYFYKGDWEQALGHFKLVVQRLIQLHQKNESSPEFIGISLKMAEIFANQGELDNAEIGYRHCITRQMKIMDDHLHKYFISKGALMEHPHKVEEFGQQYSDPVILFAMCLQQFAHFIVDYRDVSREAEACESMDEALKLAYHIYGPNHPQIMHILNNFGAACILKNRFETAKRYLKIGIDKVLYSPDCTDIIVGYYCNYAESLFHTGSFDDAVIYAEGAVRLSKSSPKEVQNYAKNFLNQMRQDLRRAKKEASKSSDTSGPGWFSWAVGSYTTSSTKSAPSEAETTARA